MIVFGLSLLNINQGVVNLIEFVLYLLKIFSGNILYLSVYII